MKNSRILILANNSGGLYRFRKELIQRLQTVGYEVIASTPFDDNIQDLRNLNIDLIETNINRRGMNPIKDFQLILKYYQLLKRVKPCLIITYTIKPNLYGSMVAIFLHIPYAINITGLGTAFQTENFIKKMVTVWYRFVCKRAKVVFFENIGNKEVFIDNHIVKEEKCCVLNGAGVNLDDFKFKDYPQDDKKIHFLFIGRIMKEKGVDELFYAIKKIHQQNENIVLDILGNYEDDYQEVIDELVNQKIINYYGYQDDVRPFIEQSHCFVLPSYHEGMANTLLESAAMGRPLITSNIHGCKEAIHNNGYLCEVKNKEDLYLKIKQFIELDYEDKKKMGTESRKHMEHMFDKQNVVDETLRGLEK